MTPSLLLRYPHHTAQKALCLCSATAATQRLSCIRPGGGRPFSPTGERGSELRSHILPPHPSCVRMTPSPTGEGWGAANLLASLKKRCFSVFLSGSDDERALPCFLSCCGARTQRRSLRSLAVVRPLPLRQSPSSGTAGGLRLPQSGKGDRLRWMRWCAVGTLP